MGYTTDFDGSLELKPALSPKHVEYLNRLFRTRRMKRDVAKLMELYNGKHGNPFIIGPEHDFYGHEGEFFANEDGNSGQTDDGTIIDYNTPPGQAGYMGSNKSGVPGLWCGWEISEDGTELMWDGGEKFYNYVEWLEWIINKFFNPWKIKANGTIYWYGEDREDLGKIKVRDNEVFVFTDWMEYDDEEVE